MESAIALSRPRTDAREGAGSAAPISPSQAALADVEEIFAEHHERATAPGLIYAIQTRAHVEATRGYGRHDAAGTIPVADTAFRIASCSKSFTAAAILILRDRGLLNLDDEVARYVPALEAVRLPTAGSPALSIRMLLTMSSGLPTDDKWADRQESISTGQFNELLAAGLRFAHVPDTAFEYSNLGYSLLGQVIEAASGLPYVEMVSSELLEPLALKATGFDAGIGAGGGVATGYRKLADGADWEPLPFSGPGAFSSIGGIFSTVEDLGQWAGWLADGFAEEPAELPSPLSRASRRELQQLHRAVPPGPSAASSSARPAGALGYGYGLFVELHPRFGKIVWHSGGYPGFGSHMRWHPDTGLAVVAFANATYGAVEEPAARALDLLLEEQFSAEAQPAPELWPETIVARSEVESLLNEWDDSLASRMFADNVPLDEPWESRRRRLRQAVADVGSLEESALPLHDVLVRSSSPAHLVWSVPAANGRLECEIHLHPLSPPKIQALKVTAHPGG